MFFIIKLLLKLLIGIVVLALVAGFARTWQLAHSANGSTFATGTLPDPLPDGFYQGSVDGAQTSWLGKTFDAASSSGINVFNGGNGSTTELYPFATSVGASLSNANLQVLKIDYNLPANPFWLRPVLDELVQTAPGQYLGKLQLRIIPGYSFALIYFSLKK